ncbi:MAG: hypothetical protein ACPGVG_00450 [Mycobacterium sp.]
MKQAALQLGDTLLTEASGPTISADQIRRGLERRYQDGWCVLHEVANHLGYLPSAEAVLAGNAQESKRYLDTVAVGLYRRTNYQVLGHEIKVSRADWLAELRNPRKAKAFEDLVSGFFVVAPQDVVRDDELPQGWGSLVWYPARIRVARYPTMRDITPPRSWTASLIARAINPKCQPEESG